MSKLVIDLSEEQTERLWALSAELGIEPEQLAQVGIIRFLTEFDPKNVDPKFRQLVEEIIEANLPLLERLK